MAPNPTPRPNSDSLAYFSTLNSSDLRARLEAATQERTGLTPRSFQLDAATALCNQKDLVVIAGTGYGKTLIMVMPCFLSRKVVAVIISPLNALEEDQAAKFRSWGLKVVVVNSRGLQDNRNLISEIHEGRYQVILTSPENALSASHLKPFFTKRSCEFDLIVHVDEAHLIKKWGGSNFRKDWYEIGKMRAFISDRTPFAAYSATLPPPSLETVTKSLHLRPNHVLINMGNFRKNIYWDIAQLSGAEAAVPEVAEFLPPLLPSTEKIPLTIIFVNSRAMGHIVYDFLARHVPPHLKSQVHLLHSLHAPLTKLWIMHLVMTLACGILICSEIAALGCDFPKCHLVIQMFRPSDLDVWLQRGGRGGRSSDSICRSLILLQPPPNRRKATVNSAAVSSQNTNPSTEEEATIQNDESAENSQVQCDLSEREVLEKFLKTTGCLWEVVDRYYGNPEHEVLTEGCCYNCERVRHPPPPARPPSPIRINQGFYGRSHILKDWQTSVRSKLLIWRKTVWKREWSHGNVLPEYLMSDKILEAISKDVDKINIPQDFESKITPPWQLWPRYGDSVYAEILKARQEVEAAWAEVQREIDERQRLAEEQRAGEKRATEEAQLARKRQKKEASEKAARKEQEEKWNRYEELVRQGKRPRGRAPKRPAHLDST